MLDSSPCERFRPDRSFRPDPAAWAAYAGRYRGDDTLTVRVKGGRLLVHSENEGAETSSVALSNTRFACDVGCWSSRWLPTAVCRRSSLAGPTPCAGIERHQTRRNLPEWTRPACLRADPSLGIPTSG